MNGSTTMWPRVARYRAAMAAVAMLAGAALAHGPAPSRLAFEPPGPGSYRLERIMRTPDGYVVDTRGKRERLSAYTAGKVTLLSLMYTGCSDEKGCPMALYTLARIRRDLEQSSALRERVRIVSLSFDPQRDTPEVMRTYGRSHNQPRAAVPWYFLTTRSQLDLAPLLERLDQDVSRPRTGTDPALMHVLKLYLIDEEGWIREIYTSAYLAPQVVMTDIKTLVLERGGRIE